MRNILSFNSKLQYFMYDLYGCFGDCTLMLSLVLVWQTYRLNQLAQQLLSKKNMQVSFNRIYARQLQSMDVYQSLIPMGAKKATYTIATFHLCGTYLLRRTKKSYNHCNLKVTIVQAKHNCNLLYYCNFNVAYNCNLKVTIVNFITSVGQKTLTKAPKSY